MSCCSLICTACSECLPKWLQRCLFVTRLVPRKTAAVSVQVRCTPYYSAVLCFRADPLRSSRVRLLMSCCSLIYTACSECPPKWLQHCLFVTRLVHGKTAAVSVQVRCTHTTTHQFTVSLYSKPHTKGLCVFSCNLPSTLWTE